jgi:hypothetical protein
VRGNGVLEQMDRGANPTINPFINPDGEKNLYNSRQPADDVANYLEPWSAILQNAGGYTPEQARAAALQVLPDILHYDRPDYELTDHTKTRRRLSELQGIDPMILVRSRGRFCPKDHQQRLELAASYPKIRVSYTQIVTISTGIILKTNEFRDSAGAPWTLPVRRRPQQGCCPSPTSVQATCTGG